MQCAWITQKPALAQSMAKLSSRKLVPDAKKVGDNSTIGLDSELLLYFKKQYYR